MELPGLAKALYGMTKAEAIAKGVCVKCKLVVQSGVNVYSPAGAAEYRISGLCELCFDQITGGDQEMDGDVSKEDLFAVEPMEPIHIKFGDPSDDAKYDFETISSEYAQKNAKLKGLDIVLPYPNQLQLDIDSEADYEAFNKNLAKFRLHVGSVSIYEDHPSKSGDPGKRHITLRFEQDLTPLDRILFQLFLGSDRTRELLSYIRYVNDDPNPTLFYEKRRLPLGT